MEMIVVECVAVLAEGDGCPYHVVDVEGDVVGDCTAEERTERSEYFDACEWHNHQEVVRLEFYLLSIDDKVHRSMLHRDDTMVVVIVDCAARIDFRVVQPLHIVTAIVVLL